MTGLCVDPCPWDSRMRCTKPPGHTTADLAADKGLLRRGDGWIRRPLGAVGEDTD